MKLRTSFLTRCLALAMALVLIVSGSNLGVALQVFAAESNETSVTVGEVVAKNYELTDAEKALLSSGQLAGGTIAVPELGNDLVTVDTEGGKITAKSQDGWVPTYANIVVGGEVKETVDLANGEGAYDTSVGNAFSVEVYYVLNVEVDTETQETLLNTAAWLKQGLTNLENGYAADTNLGTVVLAMDTLKQLARGISMDMGTFSVSAQFGEDAIAAVNALSAQLGDADDKLDLQDKNAAYSASASKTQYLLESGAGYKTTVVETYNSLNAIKNDPLTNNSLLDSYLQGSDPAGHTQWMAFKNILNALVAALEPVTTADWTAAEKGTALVAENVNYAALDTLVAALETVTEAPEVKSTLQAAEQKVNVNMSMFNVSVTVELKAVEDKDDSAVLETVGTKTATVVVAEGATTEEIVAAVTENGIEAAALAEWTAYVEGQFEATATDLPETLTEDISYSITYAPKEYTVDLSYAEDLTVPYGYRLTLAAHEDATKSYDYTVNGESYAQGTVYVVVGDTVVTRSSGKAYTNTDLYTVIANNFGNEVAQNILTSGALLGNTTINVRKPDPADAESLLTLVDDVLTASDYNASYEGLSWVPYTYGNEGTENTFSGNTAAWTAKSVKVQYILNLTNFSVEEVASVLALVSELKADAEAQKATLDTFASNRDTMGQLDKTKLGALNGVIDVTDFTPGDDTDTDEANLEMRAYFKGLVSGIIANNLDSNNYLKIYNILGEYNSDGLRYYYQNYEAVIAEIKSLSGYLSGMLADDDKIAALEIMVTAAGYPEYAEKIVDLEEKLADVLEALTEPNPIIDVKSDKLGTLVNALTAEGEVVCEPAATPYLVSETLTALDASQVMVQVIIETSKGGATVTTAELEKGTVLTQAVIDELKNKVNAKVAELLGANAKYYQLKVEGETLDALVGQEITETINTYYTYTAKEYTVVIDGEDDQTVTIEDLEINLPKHPTNGWVYKYTIDGVEEITSSTYTFTAEQLDRLFVNGSYTITRTAVNEGEEKLEDAFGEAITFVRNDAGDVIGLISNVEGSKDGMMGFAMSLVNSGFNYIALNGEDFLYMNDQDTLEISLQALINALLNDNTFSSQTLIDLGNNGSGKLVQTKITLGNSKDDLIYEDLDYTLNMKSVPSQMTTAASALTTVKNYMTFKSQDGVMNVELNLPEKVYEVYLTALLATGNVDKSDVNAINSEIAYQFLNDYLDFILESDATTTTYINTLKKLGVSDETIDGLLNRLPERADEIEELEKYYQKCKEALSGKNVEINSTEGDGIFDISVQGQGASALKLFEMIGFDLSSFDTYIGMIKEFKDGGVIYGSVDATLKNTVVAYEAVVLDFSASGDSTVETAASKFDYTADLVARSQNIAGASVVVLLSDVEGDLNFNKGTTILDLNGKTVTGNVSGTNLLIIDSTMGTTDCGGVTGTVSGTVNITGGEFSADVSAYINAGYAQENGVVQNKLYTIESDENGNLTLALNTDVIDEKDILDGYVSFAKSVAVDFAADVVMNYITTAALSADDCTIFNISLDDFVGLYASSTTKTDLINKVLNFVDAEDLTTFVNAVIDDLMDFAAIEKAINANENVASYKLTTMPWSVALEHKTEEDYLTFGVVPNKDLADEFTVSLRLDGSNKTYVANLAGGLSEIVTDNTDIEVKIEQPYYADKYVSFAGSGKAVVELDLTKDQNTENELRFSAKDYTTVLAVVLANGNPEKAEALVSAIDNKYELKKVIDQITVEDIFTALKELSRYDTFKALAEELGVTDGGELNEFVDKSYFDDEEALESIYHIFAVGAGWALEKLDITGYTDKTLGALDADGDGWYELSVKNKNPEAEVSYRGYGVNGEVEVQEITLRVNIFDGLLGDVDGDNDVDNVDAMFVLQYFVGLKTEEDLDLEVADVDGDGDYDNVDSMFILQHYVGIITAFPVEQ